MSAYEVAEVPEGVGPHEGKEFVLMRDGYKNVALFFEIEPEGLKEILLEGFSFMKFPQFEHLGVTFFTWIVFRNGFENDAIRLKALVEQNTKGVEPDREHEIGEILSYTRDEVDAFLRHTSSLSKKE